MDRWRNYSIEKDMSMLEKAKKVGRRFLNPVLTEVGGLAMAFKVLPELLFNSAERVPRQALGPFHTDATVYATPPGSGLRITWMGHSSALVEIDGVRVLTDPVWDQRVSPVQWAGPKRFFAPTLRLEELPQIDVVLTSHDHYDHLGAGTVRRLAELQPQTRWIAPRGVGAILQGFGVSAARITELDWTEAVAVEGDAGARCEITLLPTRHFSGRGAFNRFETLWGAFALRGAGLGKTQGHSVYFGADTGWWEGFAEIGAAYGPFDVTMLEIGASNELWQAIHLGPDGAARAFHALGGAGLLMPIHWGLFDLALHGWRQPIERLLELAEGEHLKLWMPEPGLPSEVVGGVELRSDWWR